ncbi:hypothetical protein HDU81_007205 [Chytriomyces hyalinus]|nr:hypothetical protein HDU81_007205 [Chytriomyces hyalinus]
MKAAIPLFLCLVVPACALKCEYVARYEASDEWNGAVSNEFHVTAVRSSPMGTLVSFYKHVDDQSGCIQNADVAQVLSPKDTVSRFATRGAFSAPLSVHRVTTRNRPSPLFSSASSTSTQAMQEFFPLPQRQPQSEPTPPVNKTVTKKVKVAVIDTGVYYLHPALGGGFGPGFPISFGSDLVGDAYGTNSIFTAVPDADPFDNCSSNSHGTHVSGIIMAQAKNVTFPSGWMPTLPFQGVALDVELGMYRVFGCNGSTQSDVMAHAIYQAAADGADVINLSIGGGSSFGDGADEVDAIAARDVSRLGVIVVSSAGNDGIAGPYVTGNPGNAPEAISVASFDSLQAPYATIMVNGVGFPYTLAQKNNSFSDNERLDIVVNDINAEANNVLDDGTSFNSSLAGKFNGKALLIRWGNATYGGSAKRCEFAALAGASSCILYGNTNELPAIAGVQEIPGMFISHEAGIAILESFAAKKEPTVLVTHNLQKVPVPTGGSISSFSSAGLSSSLVIKPTIGSYGGFIYSTISPFAADHLGFREPYGTMSGTSMAAPLVAGICANVLAARRSAGQTVNPEQMRAYLQNNAIPRQIFKSDLIHSVSYQGAGFVSEEQAINALTLVLPSALALKDEMHELPIYNVTIFNQDLKNSADYVVSHVQAATVFPYKSGDDFIQDQPNLVFSNDSTADIQFSRSSNAVDSSSSITVSVNASSSYTIYFTVKRPLASQDAPIFSGFIRVHSSSQNHTIHVPYAGVATKAFGDAIWTRHSRSVMERVISPLLKTFANGTVETGLAASTGIYLDANLTRLEDVAMQPVLKNLSKGNMYVLALASMTSHAAIASAVYVGADANVMKMAGFEANHAILSVSDVSFLDANNTVSWKGVPAEWVPLQRTSLTAGQGVMSASVQVWRGYGWNEGLHGGELRLPAGDYVVEFRAVKLSAIAAGNGNLSSEDGYDVVVTPRFTITY